MTSKEVSQNSNVYFHGSRMIQDFSAMTGKTAPEIPTSSNVSLIPSRIFPTKTIKEVSEIMTRKEVSQNPTFHRSQDNPRFFRNDKKRSFPQRPSLCF
jgi:hypothetical protein